MTLGVGKVKNPTFYKTLRNFWGPPPKGGKIYRKTFREGNKSEKNCPKGDFFPNTREGLLIFFFELYINNKSVRGRSSFGESFFSRFLWGKGRKFKKNPKKRVFPGERLVPRLTQINWAPGLSFFLFFFFDHWPLFFFSGIYFGVAGFPGGETNKGFFQIFTGGRK